MRVLKWCKLWIAPLENGLVCHLIVHEYPCANSMKFISKCNASSYVAIRRFPFVISNLKFWAKNTLWWAAFFTLRVGISIALNTMSDGELAKKRWFYEEANQGIREFCTLLVRIFFGCTEMVQRFPLRTARDLLVDRFILRISILRDAYLWPTSNNCMGTKSKIWIWKRKFLTIF